MLKITVPVISTIDYIFLKLPLRMSSYHVVASDGRIEHLFHFVIDLMCLLGVEAMYRCEDLIQAFVFIDL